MSQRIASLFSNASKSSGTYFSGKTQAEVVIPAGARVTLVKSSKLASIVPSNPRGCGARCTTGRPR
jgi:hypothetical protein